EEGCAPSEPPNPPTAPEVDLGGLPPDHLPNPPTKPPTEDRPQQRVWEDWEVWEVYAGSFLPTALKVFVVDSTAKLEQIIPILMQAPTVALDTETIRANPSDSRPDSRRDRLRLLQLATAEHTYVIDLQRAPIGLLLPFFARKDLTLIGHNIAFDIQALHAAGVPWPDCELI